MTEDQHSRRRIGEGISRRGSPWRQTVHPDSAYLYQEFNEQGNVLHSSIIRAASISGAYEKAKRPQRIPEPFRQEVIRLCWWPDEVVS